MKLLRIKCAICNKLVDRVETWHDPIKNCISIKVKCHGDFDEMSISSIDVIKLETVELNSLFEQEGIAFATKRLEIA